MWSILRKPYIADPLYNGKLYIDAENLILTSAIYSLNITDKETASRLFVKRKPANAGCGRMKLRIVSTIERRMESGIMGIAMYCLNSR